MLGIEINLGEATLITKETPRYGIDIQVLGEERKLSNFSFNGGIKFGYQHYFDKEALGVKQAYGIGGSVCIGAGIPINNTIEYTQFNFQNWEQTFKYNSQFLPINFGLDINFLWDFWESGEHTLGLSAGIGYTMNYYKSIKNDNNAQAVGVVNGQPAQGDVFSQPLKDMISHNIYPQIGLHYYYGSHQFSLNFRLDFGGIENAVKQDTSSSDGDLWNGIYNYDSAFISKDYLSLGYSYRF
ncbi:hypothetical protein [Helicobacter brantae]|uniref:Outer membrane protein beta-barrel domain-containing protein n=1 Tax=Helicobacter brantae TaxID=375927 RepID=A0A3D8J1X1_9HELI|nr:hypothetical protein [Helicobacter brantae]RDU71488.1 hypothetical protein CQA58_02785 [Helicobacter brantae]